MKRVGSLISVSAMIVLLSACGSSEKADSKEISAAVEDEKVVKLVATKTPMKAKDKSDKEKFSGWQVGKVQFLNLEGGFYGIITESGEKLLPMNLPKELAQHGAEVRVKGKEKNVMTIQQWGTPFVISEFELISPGKPIDRTR